MRPGRLVVAALATVGIAELGLLGWRSPALQLRDIEVRGNRRIADGRVIEQSGLGQGAQLMKIPTERVAARLEALPWVATARVERIVPSRVRITISERRPAAVVVTGAGPYLVDERGVIMDRGDAAVVRIADLPLPELTPGMRLTSPTYREAVAIASSLPASLRHDVPVVHASSIDALSLELANGLVIVYGAGERIREKNRVLDRLLNHLGPDASGRIAIDLRVPERPAVRPR
ncbi:MAG: cell division protein FtsQ/DivIB [Actinomycetota bacterium]